MGLSPYQTVNYVSTAWGGRASDIHITMESPKLLTLPPGCSVMVDRGYNITEDHKTLGVELVIPCFKGRGRSQMTRMEFENSERVAEAHILLLYKAAEIFVCLSVCLSVTPLFFRHDRRTATKFDTHVRVDTGLILS